MRQKSSIKFEIPVPWSSAPARIEASGRYAEMIAGTVVVIIVILIIVSAV